MTAIQIDPEKLRAAITDLRDEIDAQWAEIAAIEDHADGLRREAHTAENRLRAYERALADTSMTPIERGAWDAAQARNTPAPEVAGPETTGPGHPAPGDGSGVPPCAAAVPPGSPGPVPPAKPARPRAQRKPRRPRGQA